MLYLENFANLELFTSGLEIPLLYLQVLYIHCLCLWQILYVEKV